MHQMVMRVAIATVGIMLAIASDGEVVYSGESASVAIDSREGIVPIADSATLTYDASWIGGSSSATIAIEDNGSEVCRKTGSGTCVLPLSGAGRHELVYITYVGGVAQDEVYTATIASVGGTRGSSGTATATVVDDPSVSGGMSVLFSASDSSSSWIEVVTTNACRVSFDWKCSCEPLVKGRPYDYLECQVDGVRRSFICGETDWTNMVFYVPGSGGHVIKWMFSRDGEGSAGNDSAWVANVEVTPAFELAFHSGGADMGAPPSSILACEGDGVILPGQGSLGLSGSYFVGWRVGESLHRDGARFVVGTNDLAFIAKWDDKTLGEYVNCPSRLFTTSGDAEWVRDQVSSADGLSLRSGAISHSQTSRLETVVFGPGTVAFSCKVDGEVAKDVVYDGLAFCVDGAVQCLIGRADWTNMTFSVVGDGRHVLTWMYVKDGDGNGGGEDCAYVDTFAWTADDPLPPLDDMADESDVAAIILEFADVGLYSDITNVSSYVALRSWADGSGIDHVALSASSFARLSYAIGASKILENEPVISFSGIDVDNSVALYTSVIVSVIVKDGDEAIAVDAAKVGGLLEASCDLVVWHQDVQFDVVDNTVVDELGEPVSDCSVWLKVTPVSQSGDPQKVDRLFLRIREVLGAAE